MFLGDFAMILRRENGRICYINVLLKGSIAGILFSPKIERLNPLKSGNL
jgi:hypothetical protein